MLGWQGPDAARAEVEAGMAAWTAKCGAESQLIPRRVSHRRTPSQSASSRRARGVGRWLSTLRLAPAAHSRQAGVFNAHRQGLVAGLWVMQAGRRAAALPKPVTEVEGISEYRLANGLQVLAGAR